MRRYLLSALVFALAAACGEATAVPTAVPVTSSSAVAPSATVTASATASVAVVAAPPPQDPACKGLDAARASEVQRLKELAGSKDPLSPAGGLGEEARRIFGDCVTTKAGGAWGLGLRDLKEEQRGYSAVALAMHADRSGAVTSFPLPGQSPRTAQRSFASHEQDRVLFSSLQVFDYDGDGEDELLVMGHDQTNEGPKDPIGQIVTFKSGAVSLYGPAGTLPFFRVGDVDKDGRPDLVAYGPYRSRVPARCNGTPIVASGPSLLMHSKSDGTFSWNDTEAVAFDKTACDKPGFVVARDDEKRVDDEQTFVNLACARLWGMTEAQAASAAMLQCHVLVGESSCKDTALTSCVYPNELKAWAKVAPPLLLK